MIGGLGLPELLIILFVVLLLFGSKKLPELAKGMGKAVGEFKRAQRETEFKIKEEAKEKKELNEEKKTEEKTEAAVESREETKQTKKSETKA